MAKKKADFHRGKGWTLLSRGGGPEYSAKLIARAQHPGRIVLVFEVKTRTRRSASPRIRSARTLRSAGGD